MTRLFRALVAKEDSSGNYIQEVDNSIKFSILPSHEVLIFVQYSSLNYKDALSATGNKGITKNYPHIPGIDAGGIIEESDNPLFKMGDEVIITGFDLGCNTYGGYGQYIRVPSSWIIKRPSGLSLKECMILGTAGLTAAISIYKMESIGLNPKNGDIIVTGATGGVGSIAIAILSKLNYHIYAVTGKKSQFNYLKQLGARDIILRNDFIDVSDKPLGKRRWAGVLDTLGGPILETALKNTLDEGVITCCGMLQSNEIHTSIFPFILRGIQLMGVASADYPIDKKTMLWNRLSSVWKIDFTKLNIIESSLEELPQYIKKMLNGNITGRVLVNHNL